MKQIANVLFKFFVGFLVRLSVLSIIFEFTPFHWRLSRDYLGDTPGLSISGPLMTKLLALRCGPFGVILIW